MHWRVLPSPWTMPMPNLASAPSNAISSVAIWPVARNATDSGPCLAWIALKRSTKVASAVVPVDAAPACRRASRSSGVRGAVGRAQRRQRLPTLGAGHAEVDRIVARRREVHRVAVAQVDRRGRSRSSRSRTPWSWSRRAPGGPAPGRGRSRPAAQQVARERAVRCVDSAATCPAVPLVICISRLPASAARLAAAKKGTARTARRRAASSQRDGERRRRRRRRAKCATSSGSEHAAHDAERRRAPASRASRPSAGARALERAELLVAEVHEDRQLPRPASRPSAIASSARRRPIAARPARRDRRRSRQADQRRRQPEQRRRSRRTGTRCARRSSTRARSPRTASPSRRRRAARRRRRRARDQRADASRAARRQVQKPQQGPARRSRRRAPPAPAKAPKPRTSRLSHDVRRPMIARKAYCGRPEVKHARPQRQQRRRTSAMIAWQRARRAEPARQRPSAAGSTAKAPDRELRQHQHEHQRQVRVRRAHLVEVGGQAGCAGRRAS